MLSASAFPTTQHLSDWLSEHGIDLSLWGHGRAKPVEALWHEIHNGETLLQEEPQLQAPLRIIQAVEVIVHHAEGDKALTLIEEEQELFDGRIRKRNRSPSEKMKPGETYQEAALRCLVEELQARPEQIQLVPSSYHRHVTRRDSQSFPGLSTRYEIHSIEAGVAGLPEGDFWTDEKPRGELEMVRRHHWIWVTPS